MSTPAGAPDTSVAASLLPIATDPREDPDKLEEVPHKNMIFHDYVNGKGVLTNIVTREKAEVPRRYMLEFNDHDLGYLVDT